MALLVLANPAHQLGHPVAAAFGLRLQSPDAPRRQQRQRPARVRVVIPAAGLGTRFAPLSSVVPKELLPLGDRPLLHHALDEAAGGGFEEAVVVVSPAKEELLRRYCDLAELPLPVRFAIQPEMRGIGDAVLRAGVEAPFGVLLPDDVVGEREHWAALLGAHRRAGAAALCVRPVPAASVGRFGIVEVDPEGRATRLIEKPGPGETGSNLAIFGRYLVTEAVLAALRSLSVEGELQITYGFAEAAKSDPGVFAVPFEGRILDCGTPEEYARSWVLRQHTPGGS